MSDPDRVAADLAALALQVRARAHAVTVHHGQLLQTNIKRHAAQPRTNPRPRTGGPEGPRLLTGTYNRSIHRRTTRTATETTVTVGTNDIRARSLELGNPSAFGGRRSTLPYPHFGPGFDETLPGFQAAIAAIAVPYTPSPGVLAAGGSSSIGGAA